MAPVRSSSGKTVLAPDLDGAREPDLARGYRGRGSSFRLVGKACDALRGAGLARLVICFRLAANHLRPRFDERD